jgi:hypothetical protein
MRKAIERFLFITACCSLLGMLPLHAAQAEEAPAVDVAIASHFTPEVSAPAATISLAPIDPRRPIFGACSGPGGSCLELQPPSSIIIDDLPGEDCIPFCEK